MLSGQAYGTVCHRLGAIFIFSKAVGDVPIGVRIKQKYTEHIFHV